jgi:alpha/beta superfamily hydrolase
MNDFIDIVSSKTFTKQVFSNGDIMVDLSKLTVCGHSFGGLTALEVAKTNKKVKSSLILDPWYFLKSQDISRNLYHFDDTSPPSLIIHTTHFPADIKKEFGNLYCQKTCVDTFLADSVDKNAAIEQVEILGSYHFVQTDYAVTKPMELAILNGQFFKKNVF